MKTTIKIKHRKVKVKISYKDLLHKYKLLQDLMEHVPDVIYFKDKKGRLIMVNQAHAKGLGLKPEEVQGKTDFDIFPKERAKKMLEDDLYVMKTGKPIIDKVERATRADGIDNYVSTTKIPRYDEKGNIIGLIGITRDITKRMQLEYLRQEKTNIEKKLEALQELNKMQSEFVSVVSHELRTPLAIVKEAIMLLTDQIAGSINNQQKGILINARDNIECLKNIIDGLLDISKIESGRLKLHYSLVNLNDLLRESADFFKKLAQNKGINLEYLLLKEQVNIFIDAEKINQVISNLISNAIKFTEQSGKVKIEVKILEDEVRIGVIDTGIGIAKQDLPKLFNKFVQVSKVGDTEIKGLGLGLFISKDLIEKHHGKVWVESKLGIGSKFYFTLSRFYTTNVLDKQIRDRINNLLNTGISVYLINVLIVNFRKFKKKIKIGSIKLSEDLKATINVILKEFSDVSKGKPQIALADIQNGEYGILFPEANEKEANELCTLLKDKIHNYLRERKTEDAFINLAILSYSPEGQPKTSLGLLANLNIKKIYIGSEIRRFRRINYKVDIEILLTKDKTELSRTIDISKGGICFMSETPLNKDSQIDIKLKLSTKKTPLYIKGRVAWIKSEEVTQKDSSNKYRVGLEFTNLKNKDKKIISQFLKSISP